MIDSYLYRNNGSKEVIDVKYYDNIIKNEKNKHFDYSLKVRIAYKKKLFE